MESILTKSRRLIEVPRSSHRWRVVARPFTCTVQGACLPDRGRETPSRKVPHTGPKSFAGHRRRVRPSVRITRHSYGAAGQTPAPITILRVGDHVRNPDLRVSHYLMRSHKTSDRIIVHSNADPTVRAAPKPGSLRIPLAVLYHFPHLHGAEFKVLLVLCRHQTRSGGRDQKPFPYTIPQITEDTGLCPRAISKAISRLDKHYLILRVKKHGALPNRYRVLLEPAAPQKIPVAKNSARASKRPKATEAVEVKIPELTSPPQKQTGGRRRKEQRFLIHVERANLLRDAEIDPNQPSQAKAEPMIQIR
jgi:hypothetical protein